MSDTIEKTETKKNAKLVELTIPLTYDPDVDQYPVTISLNFKTYALKRGETVKVPAAVKAIFDEQEKARQRAYEYSMSNSLSAKEEEFKRRYNLLG